MSDSIQTIRVNTLPAYTVSIGSGLLSCCGPRLREIMPACHIAVITDTTVAPLYLARVTDSLRAAGFTVSSFAFPAGEAHKTLATFSDILEFLAEHRLTRTDCVVALGGGVVGDMAGFAAASYLRGIRYVPKRQKPSDTHSPQRLYHFPRPQSHSPLPAENKGNIPFWIKSRAFRRAFSYCCLLK